LYLSMLLDPATDRKESTTKSQTRRRSLVLESTQKEP